MNSSPATIPVAMKKRGNVSLYLNAENTKGTDAFQLEHLDESQWACCEFWLLTEIPLNRERNREEVVAKAIFRLNGGYGDFLVKTQLIRNSASGRLRSKVVATIDLLGQGISPRIFCGEKRAIRLEMIRLMEIAQANCQSGDWERKP